MKYNRCLLRINCSNFALFKRFETDGSVQIIWANIEKRSQVGNQGKSSAQMNDKKVMLIPNYVREDREILILFDSCNSFDSFVDTYSNLR